jgi:hypothetical protein
MITNWIDEGGHLRPADFPTTPIGDPPLLRPHPYRSAIADPVPYQRMALQAKRKITFEKHWQINLAASVHCHWGFATDASGKLWTLMIDSCSFQHTGESSFQITATFWYRCTIKFLDQLGPGYSNHPPTSFTI